MGKKKTGGETTLRKYGTSYFSTIGKLGGKKTAEKGSTYFSNLAKRRWKKDEWVDNYTLEDEIIEQSNS